MERLTPQGVTSADEELRIELSAFIRRHTLAVVATLSDAKTAQSAVVEFGSSDDLEIIFDTYRSARKYRNLKQDSRCSFVIGWEGDQTMQYEGIAVELSEPELHRYQAVYFEQVPEAAKFARNPEIAFFRVLPTWIRLTDLRVSPWSVQEYTFSIE